jgi:hypothetical protein
MTVSDLQHRLVALLDTAAGMSSRRAAQRRHSVEEDWLRAGASGAADGPTPCRSAAPPL